MVRRNDLTTATIVNYRFADGGLDIYVLQGKDCNAKERNRSAEFVNALVSDRGHAKHSVFSETDADAAPFWNAIGGKPAEGIAAAVPDTPAQVEKKLFKLSDETGTLRKGTLLFFF